MKYLILALLPIALVFVLQFFFSIVVAFKKYVTEDTIFVLKAILMALFGILASIIYGVITDVNYFILIIYCILVGIFLSFLIFVQLEYFPKKYLGLSFIFLQLYSILSWWFV